MFSSLASSSIVTLRAAGVSSKAPSSSPRFVVRAAANSPEQPETADQFCAGLPGNMAPMGNFDPFGFTEGKDVNTIKRYREAELTHGRVSMLAALGFVVGENFNPLFDGAIRGPAIGHFQQMPNGFWLIVGGSIAVAELSRARIGWKDPANGGLWDNMFQLKDDYIPGNIGFDPLGLSPTVGGLPDSESEVGILFKERQEQELNHGRLAMFAIMGEIAQELVTGQELFNLEDDGLLNDAACTNSTICDILETSG